MQRESKYFCEQFSEAPAEHLNLSSISSLQRNGSYTGQNQKKSNKMKKTQLRFTSAMLMIILFAFTTICGNTVANDGAGSKSIFNYNDLPFDSTETDAIQERFFTGANANDNFGQSVSSAGDVNGDGFEDLIAGAPFNDAGGFDAGRAYIYFGGQIINTVADVILTGAAVSDNFGYSVSKAGDVNGDGYGDVIVGAYLNDAGGSNAGRAYIYFGGANMNNAADVTLTGLAADNSFGFSVSTAGDFNGDGFSDVIVGAYLNNAGGAGAGRAYIFLGGSNMNNVADVTLTGAAAGDNFGYSVSYAGDVNGDGFSDVIAGAMMNDGIATNAGRAYVYFGGVALNSVADVVLNGVSANDFFGHSVSTAGDVNGDGYSDVIAGAPFNDAAGNESGRAYLFLGGALMNNTADITITGAAAGDNLGHSVSTAGDINGDGYSDILTGAYGNDETGSSAGRAYVHMGGMDPDNITDAIFSGAAANDNFGISVSSAGDFNGDGFSDIILGAVNNDAGGSDAGRAYLYLNSLTGTDIEDEIFTGTTLDYLGFSVSNAGDVNGDGYDDMIIGAIGNNSDRGIAYIHYGGTVPDNTPDLTLTGAAAGDNFGYSVSGAGDVNGDGYDDVIVGAPYNDAGGSNAGRAYLYYGGAVMNNVADVVFTGAAADDRFGSSVSDAGDVNADGYPDVIIGAPLNDFGGGNVGRVYVYFGGALMNNTADILLDEGTGNDQYGYSVSSAGDVNADGYGDLIIGAYNFDSKGAAYIYFGGETITNNPDVFISGVQNFDRLGYSVSGAGDVNKDGYSDVLVGAYGYPDAFNKGRAYLYLGGIIMDDNADATFTGELNNDAFGYSVSDAGDINKDGYSDIIIGAPYNDPGATNAGRTYIYFGSSSMNNIVDIVMNGDSENSNLGSAVSSAGDVNGDGFSDYVAGAMQDEAGGLAAGRTFLYMSSSPASEPGIISVKDVPFDQGGFVAVKWMRSGYDIIGQSVVTGYLIEKSVPPGISGYSWQSVATIPATKNLSYTYNASTQSDSMTNNSGTVFFRITALTSIANQFYRSNIMPGYSVDNLSPSQPTGLMASISGSSVQLNWNSNTESDLHHYAIFRDGNEINISLTSSFEDENPSGESALSYSVAAVDIHGNYSPLSDSSNVSPFSQSTLTITAAIQGFYNAAANNMNMSDTVTLLVRSSASPYAVVDSARSILSAANLTATFNDVYLPAGNYYLTLKHRNSIETWSASTVNINGGNVVYNFTTSASQAFGNNLIQVDASPVRFGIFSGDVNQDGTVDATDLSAIDNDAAGFIAGYVVTDLSGDSFVDGTDFAIADNNAANFVSMIRP